MEWIICAAIWLDDGIERVHLPHNIKTGVVIGGWRHPNCKISFMAFLYPNWENDSLEEQMKIESNQMQVQGFLTSKGNFVDRREAMKIALKAHQVERGKTYSKTELYSEDIY